MYTSFGTKRVKYHNVGQLQTPYYGKRFGQLGDYGPVQSTSYYTNQNPNYPYVMDKDFRSEVYLPTKPCMYSNPGYFAVQDSPNNNFVPPETYFSPVIKKVNNRK